MDFVRDETVTDRLMIINYDSLVARSFNEMPFHFCVIDEKSYFYINFMILGISMQLKSGEPLGGGRSPPSMLAFRFQIPWK